MPATRSALIPAAAVSCALALLAMAPARAEQFTPVDVTYTHTTARDSHHFVKPAAGTPANWASPIDYSKGTLHIHLEVMSKPTEAISLIDLCFLGTPGYACLETVKYTRPGVYENSRAMTSAYFAGRVDWTRGIGNIALILKDDKNNNGGRPTSNYLPSNVRVVMTIVSPGGTYVPPPGVTPVSDAGAAPDGAGATPDAISPPRPTDASPDSSSGSGGAGGSTGAGGAGGGGGQPDSAVAPPPDPPSPDAAVPPPPPATGGTSGGGTGGQSGTPPRPRPSTAGGCSITPSAGDPWAVVALIFIAAALRRRRRFG